MDSLTILGGHDKAGNPEELNITLIPGDILCIVGPTGAGKSRFLGDIECLAQGDTPTGRRILIDQGVPNAKGRFAGKLVAQLSQNMNFIMDLRVREFILMHAESRNLDAEETLVARIVFAANQLTGEALSPETPLTQLSGGQSRSLMIADTALLSPAPVVLIDELENAGVDRQKALEILVGEDKIVLVSTHDPVMALLGQRRLCIHGGAVRHIITTTTQERQNALLMTAINERFLALRELLRNGETLDFDMSAYFLVRGNL
ncbi:MAG: ATP-binding cassette domain-containing protein [Treponema sp.]|jgi:ABC-type lipoprotein export system ATPase subunit|nr:ATP-binding cassette domain-containing protein [Treponema sp.]